MTGPKSYKRLLIPFGVGVTFGFELWFPGLLEGTFVTVVGLVVEFLGAAVEFPGAAVEFPGAAVEFPGAAVEFPGAAVVFGATVTLGVFKVGVVWGLEVPLVEGPVLCVVPLVVPVEVGCFDGGLPVSPHAVS